MVRSEALRPAAALPVTLGGRDSTGYYGLSALLLTLVISRPILSANQFAMCCHTMICIPSPSRRGNADLINAMISRPRFALNQLHEHSLGLTRMHEDHAVDRLARPGIANEPDTTLPHRGHLGFDVLNGQCH
jgi:hypothetical protein